MGSSNNKEKATETPVAVTEVVSPAAATEVVSQAAPKSVMTSEDCYCIEKNVVKDIAVTFFNERLESHVEDEELGPKTKK